MKFQKDDKLRKLDDRNKLPKIKSAKVSDGTATILASNSVPSLRSGKSDLSLTATKTDQSKDDKLVRRNNKNKLPKLKSAKVSSESVMLSQGAPLPPIPRVKTPTSPTGVAELADSLAPPLLSVDIKPFFDALKTQTTEELLKTQGVSELSSADRETIVRICAEITNAIYQFKEVLVQDPINLCRVAKNMVLWTEKRHQEIKKLQAKIMPYFDEVNQLLSEEVDEHLNPSAKNLYSSSSGRNLAAQHGTILEMTPFGKILESRSISAKLKECFGPHAFTRLSHSKETHKEISGEIKNIQIGSAEDILTNQSIGFTVDIDTSVVIGVWEAVSSSYANSATGRINIYVPFGIGANSVVWNHELSEIRKHHQSENIFIHNLIDPHAYLSLQRNYKIAQKEANIAIKQHKSVPEILALQAESVQAKKDMDDFINNPKHWEEAEIDQSNVKIITRDRTAVSLKTIKTYITVMRELRSNAKHNEPEPKENEDDTNSSSSTGLD